jgi:hypothetical protein
MSINATVQRIVDDLFADQLIKGLEATEQITWIIKDKTGYDPKTGEASQEIQERQLPAITRDIMNMEGKSLRVNDELVIQMQPLEDRTSKQALSDSFVHDDREYAVKSVEVVRLGKRPMLWKVKGA